MYIQYVGFEIGASARVYGFHVINAPEGARDFTVTIQSQAFCQGGLKLQDGPGICFTRLDQELRRHAEDSPLECHLIIGEGDIREYLGKHNPPKSHGKKEEIQPEV
jgi:hypothetical protein